MKKVTKRSFWDIIKGPDGYAKFLPKNQRAQMIFLNNHGMNFGLSKTAKIVLLKSIFFVKNRRIFFSFYLGDHFFFKKSNFLF